MATPGQLVKCLSDALDIPEPTVVLYDRLLAENGLRSKGGRGTSAAKVTAMDAANLLLAILGSPVTGASIRTAIQTCEAYGRLPMKLGNDKANLQLIEYLGFPSLAEFSNRHNLRDVLTGLIVAATRGEQLIIPPDDESEAVFGPTTDWFVSVTLDGPSPWAQIIIDATVGDTTPGRMGRFVFHNAKKIRGRWAPDGFNGDLHQSRRITFKTVRRIAKLLTKDSK